MASAEVQHGGLAVQRRRAGTAGVITLAGVLRADTAHRLGGAMNSTGPQLELLAIDVEGLTSVDGDGLRALADLANHAREDGTYVVLVSPSDHVRQQIAAAGLTEMLPIAREAANDSPSADRA